MFARQGNAPRARKVLAEPEILAQGLPFANAAAVSALPEQLAVKAAVVPSKQVLGDTVKIAARGPAGSSFSPELNLALAGAAIAAAIFCSRQKSSAASVSVSVASAYGNAPTDFNAIAATAVELGRVGGGLSGPQTLAEGTAAAPAYGNPGDGPPVPSAGAVMAGMGGRLAGGLFTGLALGAGVMAAQATGNRFSNGTECGHSNKPSDKPPDKQPIRRRVTLARWRKTWASRCWARRTSATSDVGMNGSVASAWDDAGLFDNSSAG